MKSTSESAHELRSIIDHIVFEDADRIDRDGIALRLFALAHLCGAMSEPEITRQLRILGTTKQQFHQVVSRCRELFPASWGVPHPADPSLN